MRKAIGDAPKPSEDSLVLARQWLNKDARVRSFADFIEGIRETMRFQHERDRLERDKAIRLLNALNPRSRFRMNPPISVTQEAAEFLHELQRAGRMPK
jgi:hypothetical protein